MSNRVAPASSNISPQSGRERSPRPERRASPKSSWETPSLEVRKTPPRYDQEKPVQTGWNTPPPTSLSPPLPITEIVIQPATSETPPRVSEILVRPVATEPPPLQPIPNIQPRSYTEKSPPSTVRTVPPQSTSTPMSPPLTGKRIPRPASFKDTPLAGPETVPPPIVLPATRPAPSSSLELLNLMKTYVRSKSCYNPSVLENAKVTDIKQGGIAYQVDIWTLSESRSLEKLERPYNGEATPAQNVRNAWDYEFGQPTNIRKYLKEIHNLKETCSRVICSNCNGTIRIRCSSCGGAGKVSCVHCKLNSPVQGNYKKYCSYCNGTCVILCSTCNSAGMIHCSRCSARGHLLQWYQLTVEWCVMHSVSFQSNTALPNEIIYEAPGKQPCWLYEQKWSSSQSFDHYFQSIFDRQQTEFPVKLDRLTNDYIKHHLRKIEKNFLIIKLKCEIQKLDIIMVEYEADGYKNPIDPNMGMLLT